MENNNSINRKDNVRSVALGCDHGAVEQKEIIKSYETIYQTLKR